MNNLPKVVTRQRNGQELNSQPLESQANALTTTPPGYTSLTWGAANKLKTVMQSTTWGTDSETDVPCGVITLPLLCNKQVINCHIAALYQLTVALDRQTATGWRSSLSHLFAHHNTVISHGGGSHLHFVIDIDVIL